MNEATMGAWKSVEAMDSACVDAFEDGPTCAVLIDQAFAAVEDAHAAALCRAWLARQEGGK